SRAESSRLTDRVDAARRDAHTPTRRMRSLQASMAIFAALIGAAACDDTAGLVEGGGGGAENDASGADRTERDGSAESAPEAEADAACGELPTPVGWASWPIPNPAKSALPNPPSYAPTDGGNQ